MPPDWRKQLKKHPIVRETTRRLASRKRELNKDKQFILETAKLKIDLKNFLAKREAHVRSFFHKFGEPVGPRLREARQFVRSIKSKKLKGVLGDYIKYAARFGVWFRLRGKSFRLKYEIPWGTKFHVKLVEEHFEPADGQAGGGPYEYYFEADRMTVPDGLEKLIVSGKGKFVLIEDEHSSSALSELEYFANYPEGLTFIVHAAEQPYLLCLIGEKVSDKVWKQASTARSELLRECFKRAKAGRPPDISRLRRTIDLRSRPGSQKSKISVPDEPQKDTLKRFLSEQSYISRVGAALRK
jgi:hypothetical protein